MRIFVAVAAVAAVAAATTYNFSGALPYTALDFFSVPFYVPAGTAEVEVAHALTDPSSTTNILDWGLAAPNGSLVGWGGGNRENTVVGVLASSRSYTIGYGAPLPFGNWSVIVGKPRIAAPPGHYSINVTLRDAPTLAPQSYRTPYVPAAALDVPSSPRWYAGDFHVHCRESGDAFTAASVDEIAAFASSVGLDFVHLSDHNTVSAASFLADAQSRHPSLLLLPGVEYTTYAGHAGALFTTEYVDHRIGLPGVSIVGAVAAIHAQGGLFSINHMNLYEGDASDEQRNDCVGCAWDFGGSLPYSSVDAIEVGVQAWSGTGWLFIPRVLEHWDHAHALGFRHIAPIGGSDGEREWGKGCEESFVVASSLRVKMIIHVVDLDACLF